MNPLILDPGDDLARQNAKLREITSVLMHRIEREIAESGPGYASLQLAATLEEQVRARTRDLDDTLELLSISNARLSAARAEAVQARNALFDALEALEEGFALFDPADALVMCNSRFSAEFPDVVPMLGPGLGFADYVRMVASSPHLVPPVGETRETWLARRLSDHARPHVVFLVQLNDDRWIQVSATRSPSGGTAVVQTDVTGMVRRERAERARLLDDQARLVRATLDHITQGVAIFDARHELAGCNRRFRQLLSLPLALSQTGTDFRSILGFLRTAAPGAPLEGFADWAAAPPGRPALALEVRHKDGAILDLLCQEMPDRGFVVSFTDMTAEREAVAALHLAKTTLEERVARRTHELEVARDQAERAHTTRSRFVAGVSHDLLQPLNAAKLFLASLSRTALDADQRGIVTRIGSAFESVESILGALLDISNLDIGAAKAEIAAVPLAPLLRSIAQQAQPLARERGLELRVVSCAACVESDPAYLRRILQNLVVNALRYTRSGTVLVGARRSGTSLRLEVHDTGPGIPADRRADVFREFVRLETSPGTAPGMGLGLAIVERSCALLGHGLELVSEPGRGSRFSVTVPLAPCPVAQEAAPRLAGQQPLDDMIVLVVGAEGPERTGMVSVLQDWGASPLEASGTNDAAALIADLGVAPDAIVADHRPDGETASGSGGGLDGIDVVARIRAANGPIPAVVVSGDRSLALRVRAGQAGLSLLHKPLELHRLRAVLQWVKVAARR